MILLFYVLHLTPFEWIFDQSLIFSGNIHFNAEIYKHTHTQMLIHVNDGGVWFKKKVQYFESPNCHRNIINGLREVKKSPINIMIITYLFHPNQYINVCEWMLDNVFFLFFDFQTKCKNLCVFCNGILWKCVFCSSFLEDFI